MRGREAIGSGNGHDPGGRGRARGSSVRGFVEQWAEGPCTLSERDDPWMNVGTPGISTTHAVSCAFIPISSRPLAHLASDAAGFWTSVSKHRAGSG
jgi:hypothetical protein